MAPRRELDFVFNYERMVRHFDTDWMGMCHFHNWRAYTLLADSGHITAPAEVDAVIDVFPSVCVFCGERAEDYMLFTHNWLDHEIGAMTRVVDNAFYELYHEGFFNPFHSWNYVVYKTLVRI